MNSMPISVPSSADSSPTKMVTSPPGPIPPSIVTREFPPEFEVVGGCGECLCLGAATREQSHYHVGFERPCVTGDGDRVLDRPGGRARDDDETTDFGKLRRIDSDGLDLDCHPQWILANECASCNADREMGIHEDRAIQSAYDIRALNQVPFEYRVGDRRMRDRRCERDSNDPRCGDEFDLRDRETGCWARPPDVLSATSKRSHSPCSMSRRPEMSCASAPAPPTIPSGPSTR